MSNNNGQVVATGGWGLGSIIAVVISFSCNHSILWAILHGIFGWFYVIYRAIIGGY
jgi:hypothetical protein